MKNKLGLVLNYIQKYILVFSVGNKYTTAKPKLTDPFTHPDFAYGVTEAFVGTELIERHSVELAFVQVGHRSLALLLPQRARGVQRVLEAVAVHTNTRTGNDM